MRIASPLVTAVVVLAGISCGGNGGPVVDAPGVDSGSGGSGSACTGSAYDACTDTAGSSDCPAVAPMCKLFMGSGFTVCTLTCGSGADCPLQNGVAVECNMKGICKPGEANVCTE